LYYKPTCPYCIKVLDAIAGLGLDISLLDLSRDDQARQTLRRVGGKTQVPCLLVDGVPMYESDQIIAWLLGQGT